METVLAVGYAMLSALFQVLWNMALDLINTPTARREETNTSDFLQKNLSISLFLVRKSIDFLFLLILKLFIIMRIIYRICISTLQEN